MEVYIHLILQLEGTESAEGAMPPFKALLSEH